MNDLVLMKDKQAVTTSLKVAEIFDKRHRDLINSIDKLIKKDPRSFSHMFKKGTIEDSYGRSQNVYFMNRDGFSFLVLGFNNTKKVMDFKLKYINAFNQMEQKLRYGGFDIPQTKGEALQIAADYSKQIEEMKPKAVFADAVATSHTSILVSELAKILKQNSIDMGGTRLFKWLRANDYLISRKGTDWNMPTQKSMNLGLFEVKERTIDHGDHITISKTTKVTGKGQQYFVNKFLK